MRGGNGLFATSQPTHAHTREVNTEEEEEEGRGRRDDEEEVSVWLPGSEALVNARLQGIKQQPFTPEPSRYNLVHSFQRLALCCLFTWLFCNIPDQL